MRRLAFAALLLSLVAVSVGQADSIWDRRDPRYAFLFKDNRARSIGDTLVVLISETTIASEQDQRTLNRTTSGSGSVTFFDPFRSTGGTAGGTGGAASTQLQFPSQTTAMAFSGSAQTNVNHVFTDRLAVTVVDMMPNGNLVVEGYRSRVVQGEERVLRITGIVRQQDIGVGNAIPSGNVANFRISYLGRGPATRTTRQGILTRLASAFRLF
jgi:flagellar L-ring protein precursor FlgH